ncbi:hypothetical protein FPRO04_13266 [Fusarium proliferatum]|nr:hypothetical protein FPRO04_13266 [Fusarium proliferatum]
MRPAKKPKRSILTRSARVADINPEDHDRMDTDPEEQDHTDTDLQDFDLTDIDSLHTETPLNAEDRTSDMETFLDTQD